MLNYFYFNINNNCKRNSIKYKINFNILFRIYYSDIVKKL